MSDVSVHRHLSCSGIGKPDSAHPRHQSPLSLQAGFYHKPQEVGPCPVSGNAPLGSSDQHGQGIGFSIPGLDRYDYSCNSSIVRPNPGLCSTPSAGDRASGILPCSGPPLHVSSSSSVESPERSLRHEGRSHLEADTPVVSSDLVNSGILVLLGSSVPRRSSSNHSCRSRPNDGRIHFMDGEWFASPLTARGVRSSNQSSLHINFLELDTVFLTLKRFQRWLCGAHVLVQTDGTMVMHYLNRAGGTRSRWLDWKVREIILSCLSMRITLSAVHISGQDNVEADGLSRFQIQNPR